MCGNPGSLYGALGVSKDADVRVIKESARLRLIELHPDKRIHDNVDETATNELLTRVYEARRTLVDPAKRSLYDKSIVEMSSIVTKEVTKEKNKEKKRPWSQTEVDLLVEVYAMYKWMFQPWVHIARCFFNGQRGFWRTNVQVKDKVRNLEI